ncbi:MAG: hypothetical protein ABMA64_03405 [Myxococcota bacterium]
MSTPILDHATRRAAAAGRACGYEPDELEPVLRAVSSACASFGARRDDVAAWPSDLTDDGSPFELSVSYGGRRPELRVLAEVQGERPGAEASWGAGVAASRGWAAAGHPIDRLLAIEDLFVPPPGARFGWWHALVMPAGGAPLVKVYLNPQVGGDGRARVQEVMARLGLAGSARYLPAAEPVYLSLDLDPGPHARLKVYVPVPDATPDRVEAVAERALDHELGSAASLCRRAGGPGPYAGRPVLVCLSFVSAAAAPVHATVHFPIRAHVAHDGEALERIEAVLAEPDRARHRAVVAAVAGRPLRAGVGLQTYVSQRAWRGGRRVTVYLAPELYRAPSEELDAPDPGGGGTPHRPIRPSPPVRVDR